MTVMELTLMLSALMVAPEDRCSDYNRSKDYRHSAKVEAKIVEKYGQVYGPYTNRFFASPKETDIEHIVATSEAHDSGLCKASAKGLRKKFANDTLNLTLAGPRVNRYQKRDKDAAEWMPGYNKCWFARKVIEVRHKYKLTIDDRERAVLKWTLSRCSDQDIKLRIPTHLDDLFVKNDERGALIDRVQNYNDKAFLRWLETFVVANRNALPAFSDSVAASQ